MKAIIILIVLVLIGWGIYAMVGDNEPAAPANNQEESQATSTPSAAGGTELATREFTIEGNNFSFNPSTIEVNRGERVIINFINESGTHDLVVDGYNVRTKVLQSGQTETIEFITDESGSFEYYCSVGTHRQMGMKGTLIVK